MEIRPATAHDLPAAIDLLRSAGLPVEDLTAGHLALAATDEGGVLGLIGLERFGKLGLLRSLVVAPRSRGEGIGRLLVDALEKAAHGEGVSELWLLTIDADSFFANLGYEARDRADAPAAIRGSREFSSLCPGDAVLMSKSLA